MGLRSDSVAGVRFLRLTVRLARGGLAAMAAPNHGRLRGRVPSTWPPTSSKRGNDYVLLRSGMVVEPSSASGNAGLWATSQPWPSGSVKKAA